jgi:hypothetical protein
LFSDIGYNKATQTTSTPVHELEQEQEHLRIKYDLQLDAILKRLYALLPIFFMAFNVYSSINAIGSLTAASSLAKDQSESKIAI